jgi:hypothetical protein
MVGGAGLWGRGQYGVGADQTPIRSLTLGKWHERNPLLCRKPRNPDPWGGDRSSDGRHRRRHSVPRGRAGSDPAKDRRFYQQNFPQIRKHDRRDPFSGEWTDRNHPLRTESQNSDPAEL